MRLTQTQQRQKQGDRRGSGVIEGRIGGRDVCVWSGLLSVVMAACVWSGLLAVVRGVVNVVNEKEEEERKRRNWVLI